MQDGRCGEAVHAPHRLGLLEVHDVRLAGELPHAGLERASGKLGARPVEPTQAGTPRGKWRNRNDLDGKAGRRLAREGRPGRDSLDVKAVSRKPAQQADRDFAGRASFRQRRLGQDDEHAHVSRS